MIELATKVIDNEERLRSMLLHKMCHAASWLVDGVHRPPYGKCFKKWAATLPKWRKPSDSALFLKEQMPHVQQWLANERKTSEILQANVMKECGKLWPSQASDCGAVKR
eukprot:CCRYP_015470-RA/>CCRYP_015470-RA protein AED:0.24 eAED:0.24 QI:0/0/0/1/0/0/2/0/108